MTLLLSRTQQKDVMDRAERSGKRPQAYPCSIVGTIDEDRAQYIRRFVQIGDRLTLYREPDNPYDPDAVAAYHHDFKIGYIPRERAWLCRSIDEGDEHVVTVHGFCDDEIGDGEQIFSIEIEIVITKEGR